MRRSTAFISLLFTFITATIAQEWTGAVNADWNNASNWSTWPLNGEDITIDPANYSGAAASPSISAASVFSPDRMYVMNGAQLTIGANLTVTNRFIVSDDAQVVMSAGSLVVDRLVMELGGGFTLNNGSIIATRLVLGDDGVGPSTYEQLGGIVTVSGEFGFDCAAGPSTPAITISGGTLTSNTDAIWLGATPALGHGLLEVSGGTVTINGSVANTIGSTIDLRLHLTGGTFTVNGPTIDLAHATDSLVMAGSLLVLDDALVFRNDGVVLGTAGLTRIADQTELRGIGTYQFHHLDIAAGSTLRHTDPSEISIAGDWTNAGTFNGDVNTVVFTGVVQQTVETTPFFGLRIANTDAGVVLDGPSTVQGLLTLDAGLLHTTAANLLTVLDNGDATDGSDQSFVNGPLRKTGNDDFTFPVGRNGTWRRIGIAGINDQDTEFTAEYIDVAYSNTTSLAAGLSSVSSIEHWTLTRSVTNDNAIVSMHWEDAAMSGITDCDILVVAQWNGTSWAGQSSTVTGSCAGNGAGHVTSDASIQTFQAFTFGTNDGTIGIDEVATTEEIKPFPQPSSDWAMIPTALHPTRCVVLDASGRSVEADARRQSEGVRIDTSGLPTGVYTVILTDAAQRVARARLVVAH